MEAIKVQSSVLVSVKPVGKTSLDVELVSGKTYRYRSMPADVRATFLATSGSWGEAYNELVKPFTYRLLTK